MSQNRVNPFTMLFKNRLLLTTSDASGEPYVWNTRRGEKNTGIQFSFSLFVNISEYKGIQPVGPGEV